MKELQVMPLVQLLTEHALEQPPIQRVHERLLIQHGPWRLPIQRDH